VSGAAVDGVVGGGTAPAAPGSVAATSPSDTEVVMDGTLGAPRSARLTPG
jgi:hypothetical protein